MRQDVIYPFICTEADRSRECTDATDIEPHCGWPKPTLRCLSEDCGELFNNRCLACTGADSEIYYVTQGACPEFRSYPI